LQCATHPDVETELACSRCGKAICPRCMVQTPVGARCRECANVRRIPTYNVGTSYLLRAAGTAVAAGIALGIVWAIFNPITFFFFGLFAGLGIGYACGELVSIAANRKRGPPLQAIAVGGVVIAYLVRLGLLFAFSWGFENLRFDIGGLVALLIGCVVAAGRLR
jgi:hypothetical protein